MNTPDTPSSRAVNDEAALWYARLDSGSADRGAFEAWRDADPAHSAAFARIAATAEAMNDLRGHGRADDPDLRPSSKVSRRRLFPWAAGIVAAAGGGGLWTGTHARASAATPVGGRKTIPLPDGARLDLNTDSKASWKFDASTRSIWLERGEIAILVPDNQRPCLLYAGGRVASLKHGDFNARLRGTAVDLTVAKGDCTLTSASTLASEDVPTIVTAGQAALAGAGNLRVRQLSPGDLQFTASWRQGELAFEGQTLGAAVSEYNRYLTDKIVIADSDLTGIRLGGRFATRDPTDFLASLQTSFSIHVSTGDSGAIILSR